MPWKDKTVKELRKEFAESAKDCDNFSALCREFGISRVTGYKWLNRYEQNQSMEDQSCTPHNIANKTDESIEDLILYTRSEHPAWGARKIKALLERQGFQMPCEKTVNNILSRYGCISPIESQKRKPFQRFEKECCNDMWQTDFKGEFKMKDGQYCYPLDIFDDHSRYAIRVKPFLSTSNAVLPTFRDAFCEYGMPKSVLSDNGAQFAGFRHGYTQFEKWLMNHDVLPIHGRIKHPQTQGKIERFHRAMNQELLQYYTPENIEDAERVLSEFRTMFNTERPHEALGMRFPAEVYEPSDRTYCDKVTPYEYSGMNHVIKVNSWGYVRFDRWQIYLSETMIGEYMEFRHTSDGETFIACYRNFAIAEFSTNTGKLLHRKISRL